MAWSIILNISSYSSRHFSAASLHSPVSLSQSPPPALAIIPQAVSKRSEGPRFLIPGYMKHSTACSLPLRSPIFLCPPVIREAFSCAVEISVTVRFSAGSSSICNLLRGLVAGCEIATRIRQAANLEAAVKDFPCVPTESVRHSMFGYYRGSTGIRPRSYEVSRHRCFQVTNAGFAPEGYSRAYYPSSGFSPEPQFSCSFVMSTF